MEERNRTILYDYLINIIYFKPIESNLFLRKLLRNMLRYKVIAI